MPAHPVLQLIRDREASGSTPTSRSDDARLAILIEGGSTRSAFGVGLAHELDRRGLLRTIDAVYAVSAGALNAVWLVSGEIERSLPGWRDPQALRGTINPLRLLIGSPVIDSNFLVTEVYGKGLGFNASAVLGSEVEFHTLGTDVETGLATDLADFIYDAHSLQQAVRATITLPLLGGPPIELGGRRFLDGGLAENVPIETATAQGATHILAFRTQKPGSPYPHSSWIEQTAVRVWMRARTPALLDLWSRGAERRVELEQKLAQDPRVVQLFPPSSMPKMPTVSASATRSATAIELGHKVMSAWLDDDVRASEVVAIGTQPGSEG